MGFDLSYALPWQSLDLARLEAEVQQFARRLGGIRFELGPVEGWGPTLTVRVSRALVEKLEGSPEVHSALSALKGGEDNYDTEWAARELLDYGEYPLFFRFGDGATSRSVIFRTDVGRCCMYIEGNHWFSQLTCFGTVTSQVLDALVLQLGAVPDESLPLRPDEVTGEALLDLRRMVDALGEVPPAWCAAYAPDGDADGALARLWAGASLPALIPFITTPDVPRLARLGLDAWKLVFGTKKLVKTWEMKVPDVLTTIEWWLDGSAMLPAVSRVARWLPDVETDDTRALAYLVDAIAVSEDEPQKTAQYIQSMFQGFPHAALAQHGAALAELVRERLEAPTLQSLRRGQLGTGGAPKKKRAPKRAAAARVMR